MYLYRIIYPRRCTPRPCAHAHAYSLRDGRSTIHEHCTALHADRPRPRPRPNTHTRTHSLRCSRRNCVRATDFCISAHPWRSARPAQPVLLSPSQPSPAPRRTQSDAVCSSKLLWQVGAIQTPSPPAAPHGNAGLLGLASSLDVRASRRPLGGASTPARQHECARVRRSGGGRGTIQPRLCCCMAPCMIGRSRAVASLDVVVSSRTGTRRCPISFE